MPTPRLLAKELLSQARHYPIVTLTGPRQAGKSTLAKMCFPKKQYFSLEDPDIREFALSDPREFLKKCNRNAILDEIQKAPELLSYLQTQVDEQSKAGQFILSGSQNFQLSHAVSQSLAGRTAVLKLLPFSMAECKQWTSKFSIEQWIYTGFYPRIYDKKLNPYKAYKNYYETYVERDVRALIHLKDLSLFQKFIRLCAGRIGQVFVASHLANEVGVSVPTIQSWISILEATFILFFLPPYFANINKRMIKSPKLYFFDVGLANYLLGNETVKQTGSHPLFGALFENMVVMELLKGRWNQGLDEHLYFYRDSSQKEVDVIFQKGHELVPIEIKSSSTFHSDFLKNIDYFKTLFPSAEKKGYVITSSMHSQMIKDTSVVHYSHTSQITLS